MFLLTVKALLLSTACSQHEKKHVMNQGGVPYAISNPAGNYSTNFFENVDGSVEFFDVYGEVRTRYSQVYWTVNAPINLPPDLVRRFDGKVMAITGYEADQVVHTGPQLGTTTSTAKLGGFACYPECGELDKSVPIYFAYNHHYFSWLKGKHSQMYESEIDVTAPQPTRTRFWNLPHKHDFPTSTVFDINPGGEYRKSYHGFPSGYAQLIHSPQQWIVNAMQIDTHNRKYKLTDQVDADFSFLPKIDDYKTDFESGLNPLIECPCSTRIVKSEVSEITVVTRGKCSTKIGSAGDCAAAIGDFARVSSTAIVHNASLPSGCLMSPNDNGDGSYVAIFNGAQSSATCDNGDGHSYQWVGPLNGTALNPGCNAGTCTNILHHNAKYGCTGEYPGQCTWDSPEVAVRGCNSWRECQGIYCSPRWGPKFLCFARATTELCNPSIASCAGLSSTDQVWLKVQKLGLKGSANLGNLVNMTISHDGTEALIHMSGPSSSWFGVGFAATTMSDLPYAIIIEGDGKVSEHKLGPQSPGHPLSASITVISSEVLAGVRTVALSRPVLGATSEHFTLPFEPGELKMITAVGSGLEFGYHRFRAAAKIALLPSKDIACVCQSPTKVFMSYMNQSRFEFDGYPCMDRPRSDMARHGDGTGRNVPNAACSGKTYHGGLTCCQNSWFLTDAEQDKLIPDEVDTYFLKWRFYFQEYKPATWRVAASHQNLEIWWFWIDEHIDDYEEDSADYGKQSIGKITANLTVKDFLVGDVTSGSGNTPIDEPIKIMVATPHCHAPSCLFTELWNADTDQLLCNSTSSYGSVAYGPTSQVFNERGYITLHPCIFGYQEGLQEPFILEPGTKIRAVKVFNNTYRHTGQMAQWTGFFVREPGLYV